MAKTAEKVSAPKEVVQIPDAELVRQLRIDRAAKLWPSVQKVDALLREHDDLTQKYLALEQAVLNEGSALEEATDKLASYANDLKALESELEAVNASHSLVAAEIKKLGSFLFETVPGSPLENESTIDFAIRLLRSVYTARAAEVPIAEFHATSLPATLPKHCGSVLRIVPEAPNAL